MSKHTRTEYERACGWAELVEGNNLPDDLRPVLARFIRNLGDDIDNLRARIAELLDEMEE